MTWIPHADAGKYGTEAVLLNGRIYTELLNIKEEVAPLELDGLDIRTSSNLAVVLDGLKLQKPGTKNTSRNNQMNK